MVINEELYSKITATNGNINVNKTIRDYHVR